MSDAGRFAQEPRRIWSLWEMLALKAAEFYQVTSNLSELSGVTKYGDTNKSRPMEAKPREWIGTLSDKLFRHLVALGAEVSARGVGRLKLSLGDPKTTWEDFARLVDDVGNRIQDELSEKWVLSLTKQEESYLNPRAPLFGEYFPIRFPTEAIFELDEAAKCLALGRATASVFHMMRLMEVGIRATSRCLGIADPLKPAERNWSVMLRHIKDGLEKKWPTTDLRTRGDGVLFEELYVSLDGVRNAWRNTTMHVDKKYTPEEAEHIFMTVKGFMKKLSSRMDEEGNPKA